LKRIFTSEAKSTYINALLYGEPGTGKTRSAITLPHGEDKTVIIAAEPGLKTLRGHNIEVWEIEGWNDFDEAMNHLRENKAKLKFENIFIDSLSEITKICADHILKERVDIYQARKMNTKTMFADQRTLEDYGISKGRIDRLCRGFRSLPYNVFFTCHAHRDKDERTGIIKTMPLVSPSSLAEDLPGLFDHVILAKTDVVEGQQQFWWEHYNSQSQMGKDRSGLIPPKTDPDWEIVFNAYKEQKDAT
jgi:hypothetical protein